eukprot:TRINITY_DN1585_c0_g1_i1.p1 TRINITY_DN1585_c0_g1~~TRINITY_DN1585_c0_g1_i1.p1  ORF type:complete len:110 (-),score=32.51 TRINITY_DN1585_c0_g1_i1:17-346(-)
MSDDSDSLPFFTKSGSSKSNSSSGLPSQIGIGFVGGFCSAVALKSAGRAAAVLFGGAFIFLQYLSYKGYIQVDWQKVEKSMITSLDQNADGKLDKKDAVLLWNLSLIHI